MTPDTAAASRQIVKSFAASPTLKATLFGNPQFFYIREKFEGAGEEETETSSEFGADIGATLGTSRFFVGGGVFFSTVEDSDATFTFPPASCSAATADQGVA